MGWLIMIFIKKFLIVKIIFFTAVMKIYLLLKMLSIKNYFFIFLQFFISCRVFILCSSMGKSCILLGASLPPAHKGTMWSTWKPCGVFVYPWESKNVLTCARERCILASTMVDSEGTTHATINILRTVFIGYTLKLTTIACTAAVSNDAATAASNAVRRALSC